jgi:iron-sulfur cluster repair protein YtfE (RIC family)
MHECGPETSVPDWVIDRPESLRVFEELGIDYSCGGKSLETACRERGLDVREVIKRIDQSGPLAPREGNSSRP